MTCRALNTIPASAVKSHTVSINPQSAAPNMFDKVVCVGGDEGEILIAESCAKSHSLLKCEDPIFANRAPHELASGIAVPQDCPLLTTLLEQIENELKNSGQA
jgi:hypothetical protein